MHRLPTTPNPGAARGERAELSCEHADRCGGCTRIGQPYEAQLAAKASRLAQALRRYAALASVETSPVEPASAVAGYRTRAKLVAAADALGLFARDEGHVVVDTSGCPVLAPNVRDAVEHVRALMRTRRFAALEPFDEPSGAGALRALDVREVRSPSRHGAASIGTLVTFVLDTRARLRDGSVLAAAEALCARDASVRSVAVAWHGGAHPRVLGGAPRVVVGREVERDTLGDAPVFFLAAHGSFVQAHRGTAAAMHALLEDWLAPRGARGARVLELYAGSGALSLALAHGGAEVTAVESFAPAMAQLEDAAYAQRLSGRVHARTGDAAAEANALVRERARFDAVLVNPPRRGLEPEVREALAQLGAARVAYVSCEPETLARDLAHLASLGIRCRRLAPFDMMPQTDEVETIALLEPGEIRPRHVIAVGDGLRVVDARAHDGMTSPSGTPYWLEALRDRSWHPARGLYARASGLCIAARGERVDATTLGAGHYVGLARGVLRAKGAIERPVGRDRAARTQYKRLRVVGGHSLVQLRCTPDDGEVAARHLAAIGHPLLGDRAHGDAPSNRYFFEKHGLDRVFLHRTKIDGVEAESALAEDLEAVLARLAGEPSRDGAPT